MKVQRDDKCQPERRWRAAAFKYGENAGSNRLAGRVDPVSAAGQLDFRFTLVICGLRA